MAVHLQDPSSHVVPLRRSSRLTRSSQDIDQSIHSPRALRALKRRKLEPDSIPPPPPLPLPPPSIHVASKKRPATAHSLPTDDAPALPQKRRKENVLAASKLAPAKRKQRPIPPPSPRHSRRKSSSPRKPRQPTSSARPPRPISPPPPSSNPPSPPSPLSPLSPSPPDSPLQSQPFVPLLQPDLIVPSQAAPPDDGLPLQPPLPVLNNRLCPEPIQIKRQRYGELNIWKLACQARVDHILRRYGALTIRAVVASQSADTSPSTAGSSSPRFKMYTPLNFPRRDGSPGLVLPTQHASSDRSGDDSLPVSLAEDQEYDEDDDLGDVDDDDDESDDSDVDPADDPSVTLSLDDESPSPTTPSTPDSPDSPISPSTGASQPYDASLCSPSSSILCTPLPLPLSPPPPPSAASALTPSPSPSSLISASCALPPLSSIPLQFLAEPGDRGGCAYMGRGTPPEMRRRVEWSRTLDPPLRVGTLDQFGPQHQEQQHEQQVHGLDPWAGTSADSKAGPVGDLPHQQSTPTPDDTGITMFDQNANWADFLQTLIASQDAQGSEDTHTVSNLGRSDQSQGQEHQEHQQQQPSSGVDTGMDWFEFGLPPAGVQSGPPPHHADAQQHAQEQEHLLPGAQLGVPPSLGLDMGGVGMGLDSMAIGGPLGMCTPPMSLALPLALDPSSPGAPAPQPPPPLPAFDGAVPLGVGMPPPLPLPAGHMGTLGMQGGSASGALPHVPVALGLPVESSTLSYALGC